MFLLALLKITRLYLQYKIKINISLKYYNHKATTKNTHTTNILTITTFPPIMENLGKNEKKLKHDIIYNLYHGFKMCLIYVRCFIIVWGFLLMKRDVSYLSRFYFLFYTLWGGYKKYGNEINL